MRGPSAPLSLGLAVALGGRLASAHLAFYHSSMWGFNVTGSTFPYDNRPVYPLADMTFKQWWFHDHLAYPPHKGDFFELPAGGTAHAQIGCNKGATDWYASSDGGDIRQGNWPCPGQPSSEFHAVDEHQLGGTAIAITYQSDVNAVKPEDFAVISVNQNSPYYRFTDYQIPKELPACPPEGCICAWFWVHLANSGAEQMYMNGFRCKVTGATGTRAIAKAKPARRCGPDPDFNRPNWRPENCTTGPQQPNYWYQREGNNQFEDTYHPPLYKDLYNFKDGAQQNLFEGEAAAQPAPAPANKPAASPAPQSSPVPAEKPATPSPTSVEKPATPSPTPAEKPATSSSSSAEKPATSSSAPAEKPANPSPAPADKPVSSSSSVEAQPSSSSSSAEPAPTTTISPVAATSPAVTKTSSSSVVTPASPAATTSATAATTSATLSLAVEFSTPHAHVAAATTSTPAASATPTTSRRCKRDNSRALQGHRRSFGRQHHYTNF